MGRLTSCALAICALHGAATAAFAQDRSARFVEMMARLPAEVLAPASPALPEFVDFQAARAVTEAFATRHPETLRPDALRILGGPFAKAPTGKDWTPKMGFSTADLVAAAYLEEPPERRLALRLSPGVSLRVGPALLSNGYAATDAPGFPAFWRGETDFAEMGRRDPADPFTFPLPKSARIAIDDDLVLYSASWPGLASLQAAGATSPALTAFATALDLPDWGERKLVQAITFSDPMLFAPALTTNGDLTPTPAKQGGIPRWETMLLADLSDGTSDVTLIALIYTDKDQAQAAAATLDAQLASSTLVSHGDKTVAEAAGPGSARVIGNGPYLTLYTIETAAEASSPGILRNRAFSVLWNATFSRAIPLLGPTP